jgi:putative transposase
VCGRDIEKFPVRFGGIEVVHMIAKGQMKDNGARQTPADRFYSLPA